jgi:8-hydroxy-5-deazaflavin:NADPH oxidoreductase
MKIGFIGVGNVGKSLANLASSHGHEVIISNSRDPDTIRDIAKALKCDAARSDAVPALSDIVVLSVPFKAVFGLKPDLLAGRLVIDTNNYYPDRDGRIDELEKRRNTTSQMVANHFPEATIVKAFNAILAKDLMDPGVMPHGVQRALPVASDDAFARDRVAALHTDFGYDAVDAGPLSESWRFERAKPAYCIPLDRAGLVAALAAADRDVDLPEGSWRR